ARIETHPTGRIIGDEEIAIGPLRPRAGRRNDARVQSHGERSGRRHPVDQPVGVARHVDHAALVESLERLYHLAVDEWQLHRLVVDLAGRQPLQPEHEGTGAAPAPRGPPPRPPPTPARPPLPPPRPP